MKAMLQNLWRDVLKLSVLSRRQFKRLVPTWVEFS